MSPEKGTISEGKDCLCNHLFLGGVLVLFRTFLVFGWCKLSIHLVISLLNWCAKEMKQHRTGYTVAATWKEEKLLANLKKTLRLYSQPFYFPLGEQKILHSLPARKHNLRLRADVFTWWKRYVQWWSPGGVRQWDGNFCAPEKMIY